MLSDTIHDAIMDIERYQNDYAKIYDGYREHIELVMAVMHSLMEALDQPPFAFGIWYKQLLGTQLTEAQKERWRVWCEAGIARWSERLGLLGPVAEGELVERVRTAVERQQTMLHERPDHEIESSRKLFLRCLSVWSFLDDIAPVARRIVPALDALTSDTEVMPVDACEWLGLPGGSSYAEGAKVAANQLGSDRGRDKLFRLVRACWTEDATNRAADGFRDLLGDCPDLDEKLVFPMIWHSDYWLDQIARAAFGLPDEKEFTEIDFEFLLDEGKKALATQHPASGENEDNTR